MYLAMVARRRGNFETEDKRKFYRLFRVITGMETYLKTLDNLQPGDNAGVLLKGLQRTDVRRGML